MIPIDASTSTARHTGVGGGVGLDASFLTAQGRWGVSPSWFADFRIGEKTAEGFTAEFRDPVPEDATIDWVIVR